MMSMRNVSLVMTLALVAAGCESVAEDAATGPAEPPSSSSFTLTLASASASTAGPALSGGREDGGNVPPAAVDEIHVVVDGVEVRPASGGGWIPVDVVAEDGVPVDLLALGESEVVLAAADLDPDDYVDARLFVSDAHIVLNQEVCLGNDAAGLDRLCLSADTEHDVFLPSADQTGIKTDASFSIEEGGAVEVTLIFDAEATVRTIAWAPGLGQVIVSPVIRAEGVQ